MQPNYSHHSEDSSPVVVGYVRRSQDTDSIDAQKRAITEAARVRGLPELLLHEDDVCGEGIAERPELKQLLDDVQAGHIQVILVHTVDRWLRNEAVCVHSLCMLFTVSDDIHLLGQR